MSPTLDGEAYYRRCTAIIDDVEDAEGAFGGTKPKGMLRIEVQGALARHFLRNLPPQFTITASEWPRLSRRRASQAAWSLGPEGAFTTSGRVFDRMAIGAEDA